MRRRGAVLDSDMLRVPDRGAGVDEEAARRHALDLASPAFSAVLNRFPKAGPTLVVGLIEIERGCLHNTAVVVERGVPLGPPVC